MSKASKETVTPPHVKFFLSLWTGKLAQGLLRLCGRDGTNLPGKLALRLCPDFLEFAVRPELLVTVTGTNGKTTVTNLIADAMISSGRRVLVNRLGSNTETGVASALLSGLTLRNRQKYPAAVLEVDERSSVKVYPHLTPDYTVITNLTRDSVMRNAFPEYMAELLTRYIPPSTRVILNADDLISCRVSPENERIYYSVSRSPTDRAECENIVNDLPLCPVCSAPLEYAIIRQGHTGRARCPNCGLASPEGDFTARVLSGRLEIGEAGDVFDCPVPAHVDPYDVLAAAALLRTLGLPPDNVARGLASASLPATRRREVVIGGVRVVTLMAKDKNAVACSRTFDALRSAPGRKEVYLMMNCLYDQRHWSENTCWLYDCDFELLSHPDFTHFVAAGPRCLDYRLRLELAGVPEALIDADPDERRAARLLKLAPGTDVYILYGTDSVRLALRVGRYVERLAGRRTK